MIEYKVSTASKKKRSFTSLHLLARFDKYADAYRYQRANATSFLDDDKNSFILLDEYRDGEHVGRWSMDKGRIEDTVFIHPKL